MPAPIRFAPFDWSQLYQETEFSVYNGDKTVVYQPTLLSSEVEHFERVLEWFADDEKDEYEHLPKWEAIRMTTEQWERRIARRSPVHITKSKENK